MKIEPGKTTFRSIYADANPLWKVLRSQGKGVYLCEVVDGEWAGMQKPFLAGDIKATLGWYGALEAQRNDSERWYAGLREGQTVHYYAGGNDEWVRCVVARQDGKNVLKPVALVGKWRPFDLPRRQADGSLLCYGWPKDVQTGKTFTTPASNLFEYGRKGVNPTTLPALDLSVPPMTPAQEAAAALWRQVKRVKEVLDGDDPAAILKQVGKVLTEGASCSRQ